MRLSSLIMVHSGSFISNNIAYLSSDFFSEFWNNILFVWPLLELHTPWNPIPWAVHRRVWVMRESTVIPWCRPSIDQNRILPKAWSATKPNDGQEVWLEQSTDTNLCLLIWYLSLTSLAAVQPHPRHTCLLHVPIYIFQMAQLSPRLTFLKRKDDGLWQLVGGYSAWRTNKTNACLV